MRKASKEIIWRNLEREALLCNKTSSNEKVDGGPDGSNLAETKRDLLEGSNDNLINNGEGDVSE